MSTADFSTAMVELAKRLDREAGKDPWQSVSVALYESVQAVNDPEWTRWLKAKGHLLVEGADSGSSALLALASLERDESPVRKAALVAGPKLGKPWLCRVGRAPGPAISEHPALLRTIAVPGPEVLALTAKGELLVGGNKLQRFDLETGICTGDYESEYYQGADSIVLHPDGKRMVTAQYKCAFVWSLEKSKPLKKLVEQDEHIKAIALSADGERVAIASQSGRIEIRSLDGKVLGQLEGEQQPVRAMAFSADGRRLSVQNEKALIRYDLEKLAKIDAPGWHHNWSLYQCRFSADGRIAATLRPGDVIWWELDGAEAEEHSFNVGYGFGYGLGLSADARRVAFAETGRAFKTTLIVWDLLKGKRLSEIECNGRIQFDQLAFHPDGRHLLSLSRVGAVHVWDLEAKVKVWKPPRPFERSVESCAFSADGQRLVVAGRNHKGVSLQSVSPLSGEVLDQVNGANEGIDRLQVSSDGLHAVSHGNGHDKSPTLWGLKRGLLRKVRALGHTGSAQAASLRRDGVMAATGSSDGNVRVWELDSGKVTADLNVGDGLRSLAFLSNDQLIVSTKKSVALWDVATERCVRKLEQTEVNALLPLNENQLLAGGPDAITKWDLSSGREIKTWKGFYGENDQKRDFELIAEIPTGAVAVALWNGKIWGDGTKQPSLSVDNIGLTNAIHPEGSHLATVGRHHGLVVFDLATGQPALRLPWDLDFKACAFSSAETGSLLAVGDEDGEFMVLRWLAAGRALDEAISAVTASPAPLPSEQTPTPTKTKAKARSGVKAEPKSKAKSKAKPGAKQTRR
jgi:WD40 repeat protein